MSKSKEYKRKRMLRKFFKGLKDELKEFRQRLALKYT